MIYMTYSLIHAEVWENRISYLFMRSILNRKLQLSNVIISNFRQRIQLKYIQLHKENKSIWFIRSLGIDKFYYEIMGVV